MVILGWFAVVCGISMDRYPDAKIVANSTLRYRVLSHREKILPFPVARKTDNEVHELLEK